MLGLPAIGLGLRRSIPILVDPPDILVAPDGKAVAVRDASGMLRVSGSRAGSYVVEQFFDEEPGPAPDGAALREGVRCDAAGLPAGRRGAALTVAHVLDPAAFPEDCRRADIVVTPLAAPADCRAPLVIDAPRLAALRCACGAASKATRRAGFAIDDRSAPPFRGRGRPAAATADEPVSISAAAP